MHFKYSQLPEGRNGVIYVRVLLKYGIWVDFPVYPSYCFCFLQVDKQNPSSIVRVPRIASMPSTTPKPVPLQWVMISGDTCSWMLPLYTCSSQHNICRSVQGQKYGNHCSVEHLPWYMWLLKSVVRKQHRCLHCSKIHIGNIFCKFYTEKLSKVQLTSMDYSLIYIFN